MLYLLTYSAFMIVLVCWKERSRKQTPEHFLLADREVGGIVGAMSIAASWIWAPALFVSTQVGYQWGYSALVWFIIPNMLALLLFVAVAQKVRKRIPLGFSYLEHIRDSGKPLWFSQLSVQLLMQVVIFALQLTAGAELLSFVAKTSYSNIVIAMTITALAYSLIGGLNSSVFTDAIQYLIIGIALLTISLALPSSSLAHLVTGRAFEPFNSTMLTQFGISSAVGLLLAIFADHQQWQRIFAVKQDKMISTYVSGSLLHGAVTFALGTLGVIIFNSGYSANNIQLVGIEYIGGNLPEALSVVFVFMALCGLCSTLDSCLCAFSSLYSTEISRSDDKVRTSRKAMWALAIFGLAVALLRLPLITLWFLASTIRLAAVTPTVMSVVKEKYSGNNGAIAIISGLLIGGGVFILGIVQSDPWIRTLGMITAVLVSSCISFLSVLTAFNLSFRAVEVSRMSETL